MMMSENTRLSEMQMCIRDRLIELVVLGAVLLWFLLSFAFKPIGALFTALWKDAIDEIKEENKEEKENN